MNERTTNERKYKIIRWSDYSDEPRILALFSTKYDVMNDDTKYLQALCVFGLEFDGPEIEQAEGNEQGNFVNIDEFINLY